MEPALDVINSALHGDVGARSFLERTTSIYVLDATDTGNPKTYGCWNFIHQAMNEVERYEAKFGSQGQAFLNGSGLVSHVRLLSTMALRVARRSPTSDKALIVTCLANAEHFSGTPAQSQWLIDLNFELREIVMGRIAAMAFDFSFHRKFGPHEYSAFADYVVMDTFCAVLSANAVSSGPGAVRHFATEWIIPSSKNLPAFSVASVVHHLALEGIRKSCPSGTKDILQQLSSPVMSMVLIPLLSETVTENSTIIDQNVSPYESSSQIAGMCFRAIEAWCKATDLSLPQIKHISTKAGIDLISDICDAMYSDSPQIIEALAELVETVVVNVADKPVTEERMNQVRHIIQVDEDVFQSRFSPDQLTTIESKEMEGIVSELGSSIALQRFRFTERQASGDHDVCRNLARIATTVCTAFLSYSTNDVTMRPEPGMIALLHLVASHPFVNISTLAISILARTTDRRFSLADDLLPILQRRAIIPHCLVENALSLAAAELCGVDFCEFEKFRDNILAEALAVCWNVNPAQYMNSCTSAIEEFCNARPSLELSLQLEAAIYCIEAINGDACDSHTQFPCSKQLRRCIDALAAKPLILTSNWLTLSSMCRLIRKYSSWFVTEGYLDIAMDLCKSSFFQAVSGDVADAMQHINDESGVSPAYDASFAMKELLITSPKHFTGENRMNVLSDVWEVAYSHTRESRHPEPDALIALFAGICSVLTATSTDKQITAFDTMVSRSVISLDLSLQAAKVSADLLSMERLTNDIRILGALPRAFTNAISSLSRDEMESGCDTSPDTHAPVPEGALLSVYRGWDSILAAASSFSHVESIVSAITSLLRDLSPSSCADEASRKLMKDLFALAKSMLLSSHGRPALEPLLEYLGHVVHTFGEGIETCALATLRGTPPPESEQVVGALVEDLLLSTITAARSTLGDAWTSPTEQKRGQPAFESKPSPVRMRSGVSNETLAGMFALLKNCLDSCPVFILHLPAVAGVDRDGDLLLRRAIDSAVVSINDSDPSVAGNAMSFLKAAIDSSVTQQEELRIFLTESLTSSSREIIHNTVLGCCGAFEHSNISIAANLLSAILSFLPLTYAEGHVTAAFHQGYFRLGDQAKNLMLRVLKRSSQRQISSSDLALFLDDVWDLHQVEDTDSLPNSDVVARFLRKFTVNP